MSSSTALTAPDLRTLAPVPTYSGAAMAQALTAYRELQAALDRAMPDQIQRIGDRDFRKKGYWRAVAVAFNLDVELVRDERDDGAVTADGEADWGYLVTYRASTKSGRAVTGDGACYASEKAVRQRTVHNVRAHASTRAFNRAVSNLVGFGEVSAEELEDPHAPAPAARPRPRPSAARAALITQAQRKQLFDHAKAYGWSQEAVVAWLKTRGFESTLTITPDQLKEILAALEHTEGTPTPAEEFDAHVPPTE